MNWTCQRPAQRNSSIRTICWTLSWSFVPTMASTRVAPSSSTSKSDPTTRTSPQKWNAKQRYDDGHCKFLYNERCNRSALFQVYHPNIDLEGNVCLNILREDWKPVLTINAIVYGIQFLFLEPNPDDPLNKEAAEMLQTNRRMFEVNVLNAMRAERCLKWYSKSKVATLKYCIYFIILTSLGGRIYTTFKYNWAMRRWRKRRRMLLPQRAIVTEDPPVRANNGWDFKPERGEEY